MRLPVLTAVLALVLAAPAADAAERKVPQGFVGVMYDRQIQDAAPSVQNPQWGKMAEAGVETARVIFSWDQAQPEERKPPSFKLTDAMVEQATRHGIELLPVVTQTPPWARLVKDPASAPRDNAEYVMYLKGLIRRYGPGGGFWAEHPKLKQRPLRTWQIWNEPHLEWQLKPTAAWAERYGALLRQASRSVKKADPGARVVVAGLANAAWTDIDKLYRRGRIKGSFDVAALHMYSKDWAELIEILRRFRTSLDANGDTEKPIFITEVGVSASFGTLIYPEQEHFQTTAKGMASLIPASFKRFAALRDRMRLERVYWYTWASEYTVESNMFGFSGLNYYNPGTLVWPLPALAGYRKMARALEGCKKDTKGRCRG